MGTRSGKECRGIHRVYECRGTHRGRSTEGVQGRSAGASKEGSSVGAPTGEGALGHWDSNVKGACRRQKCRAFRQILVTLTHYETLKYIYR